MPLFSQLPQIIAQFFAFLEIAILIEIILSWLRVIFQKPLVIPLLTATVEDMLERVRSIIPTTFAGFDISPIVLIFVLRILESILVALVTTLFFL